MAFLINNFNGYPLFFRSSSPKGERKPFSDEVNANGDIESSLSVDEVNAYKALIDGCSGGGAKALETDLDNNYDDNKYAIDDLKKSVGACNDNSAFYVNDVSSHSNNNSSYNNNFVTSPANNPLPLPPKSVSLYSTNPKRHVRKNPLILPSSRVTNLVNRSESVTPESPQVFNLQVKKVFHNLTKVLKRNFIVNQIWMTGVDY